jgi:hypothetical protein
MNDIPTSLDEDSSSAFFARSLGLATGEDAPFEVTFRHPTVE